MPFPKKSSQVIAILAITSSLATASQPTMAQTEELKALAGEWIFLEDRTEGRTLEQINPPMSSKFSFRIEDGAVILESGHGGLKRNTRVALDGSMTELPGNVAGASSRYRGTWKDGAFTYEIDFIRAAGGEPEGLIKREFRLTKEGLIVRSNLMLTPGVWSVGLYRHPQDIAMPTPAKAAIGDLAWLAGAWVGTRGAGGAISMEERWTQPLGGAMLAISRTVSRGRMGAFEFLRIVEREGGLVYVAQPGGAPPTEFVLSELTGKRAVFDNPRHDYPKRIVYELSAEGSLTATVGFMKGGTPRKYEYKREGN